MKKTHLLLALILLAGYLSAQTPAAKMTADAAIQKFEPLDVFELEHVSDPQISPDGQHIVYARNFRDIMTDRTLSNLWVVDFDGKNHQPLTTGNQRDFSPAWSPDGKQLAYRSSRDGSAQIYLRWMDTGAEAKLTNLIESPGAPVWSPDGKWLAFVMFVPEEPKPFISLPKKPEGAKWGEPAKYIDEMNYRGDGQGYLKLGHEQVFVLSAGGGTPRQVTAGAFDCGRPVWSKDGKSLLFAANRHDNHEFEPRNSEIYEVTITSGNIRALTNRPGPDNNPALSPDGSRIAFLGSDDRYQGYQIDRLTLMNRDGSNQQILLKNFDREVENMQWRNDGQALFFQYDDKGNTKIAQVTLDGKVTDLTQNVGGLSIDRPYSGGDFSVAANGNIAFTHSEPDHLADLATYSARTGAQRLTRLNDDLFTWKKLGAVEEMWCKSSFDGRDIQSWICRPPDFDPTKKYPLILEIHGGPFTNYGDRFAADVQLYAAAGYVVLYVNPRGSTSYGEEFGNLIHHNYPSQDYDDLMSAVDAAIARGYVDENQLFVTGGSGGGVLTAWIVGHTDRFRAAVVAKPVINWYSFVLNADGPGFFYKYWFPGLPWDHLEHYMKRSPITYASQVKTPTMVLSGEVDYRTPISEAEQYYAALKLSGVETAMVRFPQASHGIANRPSYLISKALHTLGWFEKYRKEK